MKILRIVLFLLTCSAYGQADKITDSILNESASLVYQDIGKAGNQALFVMTNPSRATDSIQALLVLTDVAYLKGDFAAAMRNLYAGAAVAEKSDSQQYKITTQLYLARYYRLFGFEELSAQKRAEAYQLLSVTKMANKWQRYQLEEMLAQKSVAGMEAALQKAIPLAQLQKTTHKTPLQYEIGLAYASILREKQDFANAHSVLESILEDQSPSIFKARAFLEMALIDRAQGNPSLPALRLADAILNNHTDVPTQVQVCKLLAEDLLNTGNVTAYKKYLEKCKTLDGKLVHNTKEARDGIITHLEKTKARTSPNSNYYMAAAVALLLLFLYLIYVYFKTRQDYRKFLKAVENPAATEIPPSKPIVISQKTEQALLEKLSKFEKSNKFTNPNITIVTLAKSLDTNTKYLSEVINRHKEANFNQYLNDLRIHYIIAKMKEDSKYLNYKIYYLAKECGFSSQSTFSTVFRGVTGISPLSFIKFLKNENNPK